MNPLAVVHTQYILLGDDQELIRDGEVTEDEVTRTGALTLFPDVIKWTPDDAEAASWEVSLLPGMNIDQAVIDADHEEVWLAIPSIDKEPLRTAWKAYSLQAESTLLIRINRLIGE